LVAFLFFVKINFVLFNKKTKKMKKIYLVAILLLVANFVNAQIVQTSYRGAFAPGVSMWTDNWTNWDPKNEDYTDQPNTVNPTTGATVVNVVNVTTNITSNTTWYTGKTYYISGLIYVKNNATLTIQPGVIVKGAKTSTGTALIVTKGAKLNAVGTAVAPIVFTSALTKGNRQPGDWGGIVLLGKGSFNLNNGINNIEGITASVDTEYGGGLTPNDNDNSGTLKYVRIEFGGFVFSPNNEINGLTLGAVGRGTTIDNVQVSFAADDSFEWFGGSVNCKHLVAYRGLDDDFDTDNGFSGICQFGLGIKDPSISDNPSISTSEGFESDNNASGSSVSPYTSCVFTNYTMIGPKFRQTLTGAGTYASGHKKAARLRRNSKQKIFNSIFLDFAEGLHVDGKDAELNAIADDLKWKNNIIAIYAAGSTSYKFLQVTAGSNTASTSGSNFNMTTWYNNNNNTSLSVNTSILEKAYNTTATDYSGLDYRPAIGSVALSGASFTDTAMAQYVAVGSKPGVTNLTYCKGAVAAPLTAQLAAGGVSLKWYATATATTPIALVAPATAPVPSTATVTAGSILPKSYFVSQMNEDGTESDRSKIDVTITASPTVALGAITGSFTEGELVAPVAVGPYVGTTTQFTYTIAASSEAGVASYLWTVPSGATIVSGQGTTSVVVDFANIPAGAGALGSISVQAVNAGGCAGVAKTLALTKALPVAPASIKLIDAAIAVVAPKLPVAIVNYAKYMGTTTPLTLTATVALTATSYQWELPAGVNLVTSGTPVETKVTYTSEPFLTAGTVPSTVGTKYWVVTSNAYTYEVNGVSTKVTVSTAEQKIYGTGAASPKTLYGGTTTQAYARYGTVITSDKPSILVNFAGVTNPATTLLYIGVKSKNGVGVSTTSNATNADVVALNTATPGLFTTTYTETLTAPVAPVSPSTIGTNGTSVYNATGFAPSTAKLLKLTATLPAAPAAVKMTIDANSTLAVTNISKYIGTTTSFTLTATASPFASSYAWELPSGVNQLSGGTTNVITVNFADVAPGTTSLYLGAKAVNGVGSSSTINSASTVIPSTTSTSKLLKVTSSVPAAVATVTGQIAGVCGGSSYTYTMLASLLANSYEITAPTGSVVTSPSNLGNTTRSINTSDLTFTVTYPQGFNAIATTDAALKSIFIYALNGVGSSVLIKSVVLSTLMPAVGTNTGGTTFTRCANKTFTIPAVVGATNYVWTVADGATIVSGQGTTSVEVDFSQVSSIKTSNKLSVAAVNACGVSTAVKAITLTSNACPLRLASQNEVSSTEVYPNPTSGEFNVDVTVSTTSVVEVSVYSFDGVLVVSPKAVKLQAGTNTISQDISSLNNGVYFVQIANALNNEIITKKMIKQ
jgi:hypothetical protein